MSINHLFDDVVFSTTFIKNLNISISETRLKVKFELEHLRIKNNRSPNRIKNTYKKYKLIIDDNTHFLSISTEIAERIYCFVNNITNVVKCRYCKINNVKFNQFSEGYRVCCCNSCAREQTKKQKNNTPFITESFKVINHELRLLIKNELIYLRYKFPTNCYYRINTYIKYRSIINSNTLFLKDNVKEEERVYCYINNIIDHIKCQFCKVNNVKFRSYSEGYLSFCGSSCAANANTETRKATNLKILGCEYPIQNLKIKNKIKKTNNKLYNCDHPMQNKNIMKKAKQTLFERTGYKHALQDPETFEKQQKSSYKLKDYIMPSGKIIKIQGYEDFVLDILLETHTEYQILTNIIDMPEIWYYVVDKKRHRYFCDIFIPHENKLIEVKSTYTYNGKNEWEEINLLKQQASRDLGYEHEIWIIDKKKIVEII